MSKSASKAVRDGGSSVTNSSLFQTTAEKLVLYESLLARQATAKVDAVLDEHRASINYTEQVVNRLGPEIRSSLGQFHDYRALAGRVQRNISAYLERLAPGKTFDQQLDAGPHEIVAAYWATVLMIDKFDTALFLLEPDAITATSSTGIRFHGLATKYRKIYQREFETRGLKLVSVGESFGVMTGNAKALAVIPQTFLDNAAKYAPSGSSVTMYFTEDSDYISFSVSSLGPKIFDEERRKIFEPFFRGRAAKEVAAEGMGFGLAVCQLVANRIGTKVLVDQNLAPEQGKFFMTTFSVRLQKHTED